MAWNSNNTVELTGKVDGVEIKFTFYPDLGYFEAIFPRQFDETYNIELYARDVAGNLNYLTTIEVYKGRVVNPSHLINVLFNRGIISKKL